MTTTPHQYSIALIQRDANGSIVQQRATDGYINATALCQAAGKRIAKYLENDGTKEFLAELSADVRIRTSELTQSVRDGFPENQGTWVHPQVAINLAQWLSPKFAVQVSRWVYDWMSGKTVPQEPVRLPHHLQRYILNDPKIPPGYFSILQETALGIIGPLYSIGFTIPKDWVPDISVGKAFCKWLREVKKFDTSSLPKYEHDYLDGRIVEPNLYPDSLLADYRYWLRCIWLPENGVKYFKKKDPGSLVFLDQLPALAAPVYKTVH